MAAESELPTLVNADNQQKDAGDAEHRNYATQQEGLLGQGAIDSLAFHLIHALSIEPVIGAHRGVEVPHHAHASNKEKLASSAARATLLADLLPKAFAPLAERLMLSPEERQRKKYDRQRMAADQFDSTKPDEEITVKREPLLSADPSTTTDRLCQTRNALVLATCFFFVLTGYLSARNLTSSLYPQNNLGMISLSVLYFSFALGSFVAPSMVEVLHPKRAMLLTFIPMILYSAANFYPTFYTLIPASCLVGLVYCTMCTAQTTYLSSRAAIYAKASGSDFALACGWFNNIYYIFAQLAQIVGSLVSSLVLVASDMSSGNSTVELNVTDLLDYSNITVAEKRCGANFCPSKPIVASNTTMQATSGISPIRIYSLFGFYTFAIAFGALLMLLCLKPLENLVKKDVPPLYVQVGRMFGMCCNGRLICLVPLMLYSQMYSTFMFGDFTKAFATCTVGVYLVGYTMMSYASAGLLTALVCSVIVKHVGINVLYAIAFTSHGLLLGVMYFWQPVPTQFGIGLILLVAAMWGVGDGIISPQTVSLLGTRFPDKKEAVFALYKLSQACMATVNFLLSPYLCMVIKIFFTAGLLLLTVTGFTIHQLIRRSADNAAKRADNAAAGVDGHAKNC